MDLLPRLLGLPEHCKEDDEEEYSPSKNGPSVLCKHGSATQGSFKREININLLVWRCGSAGQCIVVMGNTLVNAISLIPLFSYIIVGFGLVFFAKNLQGNQFELAWCSNCRLGVYSYCKFIIVLKEYE